jgi:nucleosome binding factor SPN SPT16 subunit
MSDRIVIDGATFRSRILQLQKKLRDEDPALNGAQSIVIITGKNDEENLYMKSSVLHVSGMRLHRFIFGTMQIAIDKNRIIYHHDGTLAFLLLTPDMAPRLRVSFHSNAHWQD